MIENVNVRLVTITEAKALPNMLGRIVTAMLRAHGEYWCEINGRATRFIRVEEGSRVEKTQSGMGRVGT